MTSAGVAAGIVVTGLAFAAAAPAHADEFRSKKDRYLDAKAEAAPTDAATRKQRTAELDKRVGAEPQRLINLYNQWTREYLAVPFDGDIPYDQDEINRYLRCRFTNQPTEMDDRLIGVLVGAARKFDADRLNIVSGYRSPKYNLILQKKGRNVSRDSQHTYGHAVDFRIPGVGLKQLHRYVRALHLGGVGFYTQSRFIHADVGRVRYWTAR